MLIIISACWCWSVSISWHENIFCSFFSSSRGLLMMEISPSLCNLCQTRSAVRGRRLTVWSHRVYRCVKVCPQMWIISELPDRVQSIVLFVLTNHKPFSNLSRISAFCTKTLYLYYHIFTLSCKVTISYIYIYACACVYVYSIYIYICTYILVIFYTCVLCINHIKLLLSSWINFL